MVTLLLMIYDFIAVVVSYLAALWIRFDCHFSMIDTKYFEAYYKTIFVLRSVLRSAVLVYATL